MPIAFTITIAFVGLISTCCGLVLTVRSIKNTGPGEAIKKWRKEIDVKLDNDNRHLQRIDTEFLRLDRELERRDELDRLVLRSLKGILDHLAEGNHTNAMKDLVINIDDYLISR